jgi:hypothetical protein
MSKEYADMCKKPSIFIATIEVMSIFAAVNFK